MKSVPVAISIAGSQLGEIRHVCAFFNSDEEEYRVLLPFIKDGLKSGDKAVHVLNPEQSQDHLQGLSAAGIDPAAAQQSGQLELRVNTEVYLPDGRFDQDRMLQVFEQLASGNSKSGFPLSRAMPPRTVEDVPSYPDVFTGWASFSRPEFEKSDRVGPLSRSADK